MNTIDRPSSFLTLQQAENIIGAASHAFAINHLFNFFITINWNAAHISLRPQVAAGQYLKLVGDWVATRGSNVPRYYVWIIEHDHTHILLHVPVDVCSDFRRIARHWRWLKALGGKPEKTAIHVKPITGAQAGDSLEDYIFNLARLVCYIAKGLDQDASRILGIKRLPQGTVRGKRFGMSETLTPNARQKYVATLPDISDWLRPLPESQLRLDYDVMLRTLSNFGFDVELLREAAQEGVVDAKEEIFSKDATYWRSAGWWSCESQSSSPFRAPRGQRASSVII